MLWSATCSCTFACSLTCLSIRVSSLPVWQCPQSRRDSCSLLTAAACCCIAPLRTQTPRHAVLEAYTLVASKNRANVEQAIQHLGAILSDNPNDVRALLALSTALMVLKQTPKVTHGRVVVFFVVRTVTRRCWL